MGVSKEEFLGTVYISLSSIMILPIFAAKVLAGFPHGENNFYASDYVKNCSAALGYGSFPFVSFPSQIAPELILHLQNFRRN